MAFISIEKFDEAIEDCNKAIELKPDFAKVLYFFYFLFYRLIIEKLWPTEKN